MNATRDNALVYESYFDACGAAETERAEYVRLGCPRKAGEFQEVMLELELMRHAPMSTPAPPL